MAIKRYAAFLSIILGANVGAICSNLLLADATQALQIPQLGAALMPPVQSRAPVPSPRFSHRLFSHLLIAVPMSSAIPFIRTASELQVPPIYPLDVTAMVN
jgi:hypothetical protein